MNQIIINKNLQWVHLENPQEKDIKELKEQFNIHPIILDELLRPSDRSKVENHGNYVFLVYHLPIYVTEERTSRRSEIDVIATKRVFITVAYEKLEPLEQFSKSLGKKLKKDVSTTAEMLYYLLEEVNDFSMRQLKHVERKVNFVGDLLFKEQNRKLLEEISHVRRDLLDFSIIAVPQRTTLESLEEVGVSFWGEEAKIYFTDLLGDFLKVQYMLENLKATIESYSDTISQIFEFKTSEVVRRFTVLVFLTFPIMLYATMLLQPKIDHALINSPADYWLQMGIVAVLVIGLAVFFRKKGWL
jgi:magnesium transporter